MPHGTALQGSKMQGFPYQMVPTFKTPFKKTRKVLLRRRQGCPSSHFQGKTQSAWATFPLFILPHRAQGRILGATKPHLLTAQMGQQGLERLTCLSSDKELTACRNENLCFLIPSFHIPYCLILLAFFIPLLRYTLCKDVNAVSANKCFFFQTNTFL